MKTKKVVVAIAIAAATGVGAVVGLAPAKCYVRPAYAPQTACECLVHIPGEKVPAWGDCGPSQPRTKDKVRGAGCVPVACK